MNVIYFCVQEVETSPAYPDICFAVDDFDSTFEAVVLTNADHCYCVVLNAVGGAAFPSEKLLEDNTIEINKRKGSLATKRFVKLMMMASLYLKAYCRLVILLAKKQTGYT